MKNNLTLPSLANKCFNLRILRDENDEAIYTYNDEYVRHFVRLGVKGGRCLSMNQYYKSTISDELFIFISKSLDVNGNINEILDKNFQYTKKT